VIISDKERKPKMLPSDEEKEAMAQEINAFLDACPEISKAERGLVGVMALSIFLHTIKLALAAPGTDVKKLSRYALATALKAAEIGYAAAEKKREDEALVGRRT
jgi:hypothetical protein